MENQIILDLINKDVDELKLLISTNKEELLSNSTMVRLALLKAKSLCEELQLLADKTETLNSFGIDENEYFVDDEEDEEKNNVPEIFSETKTSPTKKIQSDLILKDEVIEEVEKVIEDEFDETDEFEVLEEEVYVDEDDLEEEAENPEEKKVIGENFEQKMSLNDKFSNSSPEQPTFQNKITDLKLAIGLNDRFLYTRELFDNNPNKFSEAIDELNEAETTEQAITYLENNFQWKKTDTSIKFLDLVKRRFQK